MENELRKKLTDNGVFDYERDVKLYCEATRIFGDLTLFLSRINAIDAGEIQELNRRTIQTVKDFDTYQEFFRQRIAEMRARLTDVKPTAPDNL